MVLRVQSGAGGPRRKGVWSAGAGMHSNTLRIGVDAIKTPVECGQGPADGTALSTVETRNPAALDGKAGHRAGLTAACGSVDTPTQRPCALQGCTQLWYWWRLALFACLVRCEVQDL